MRLFELARNGGYLAKALAAARANDRPRTGVHVSTIIDRLLRQIDPRAYATEFSDEQRFGYQEVGNVVEDVLADWLRRRVADWEKPAPRTHYGITGSPDGWSPRGRALHEIKACWKSERTFTAALEHFTGTFDLIDLIPYSLKLYGYVLQLLTYGEPFDADRGYLHVLFINGSYPKGAPAPSSHTYTVTWTPRERTENFDRMLQFAKDMELL